MQATYGKGFSSSHTKGHHKDDKSQESSKAFRLWNALFYFDEMEQASFTNMFSFEIYHILILNVTCEMRSKHIDNLVIQKISWCPYFQPKENYFIVIDYNANNLF